MFSDANRCKTRVGNRAGAVGDCGSAAGMGSAEGMGQRKAWLGGRHGSATCEDGYLSPLSMRSRLAGMRLRRSLCFGGSRTGALSASSPLRYNGLQQIPFEFGANPHG